MLKRTGHAGPAVVFLSIIVLAVTAVILLNRPSSADPENTIGEVSQTPLAEVEAVPILLRPGVEGLALIDKKNYTICIYQYQTHQSANERLVLLAARSFRYDVQLEDYNTAEPRPAAIKELVLRARQSGQKPQPEHDPQAPTTVEIDSKNE
jgi:hypothetical protein